MRELVKYNSGVLPFNEVAFIFSCPGQRELVEGKVTSGTTGDNLDILLAYLNSERPKLFQSTNRYDYLITNSSDEVYYKGYQGSELTEPKHSTIRKPENLSRIRVELRNTKLQIAFGGNAQYACGKLGLSCVNSYHLSLSALNRFVKLNLNGGIIKGSTDATQQRLKVVADRIVQQLP